MSDPAKQFIAIYLLAVYANRQGRNSVAGVAEVTATVIEIELIGLVIFTHQHEVQIGIAVEIDECDLFAIMHITRQAGRAICEYARAIVQQQDIRFELHRECQIEIAIAIGISGGRIHAAAGDAGG